ncbi:hypothetical protein GVX82_05205, partial [Patescibacteria group bacterium]|nr:hypothetical protein [Patescibacteria group bacterium]
MGERQAQAGSSRVSSSLVGSVGRVRVAGGIIALGAFAALLWVGGGGEGRAAIGDYAIYREATGLETIGTSPTLLDFDTTETQGAGFSIDTADDTVTLADPGHYLVLYNFTVESSGGSNRSEVQGRILLDGTPQAYGRGTCYVRRTDGADECAVSAGAIIEATSSNQTIEIEAERTDSNTASVRRRAGESGLTILRLDTIWDYARLRKTNAQGGTVNFTPIDWNVEDELDSATFARSGGDLTLAEPGYYLVAGNVMFQNSGTGRRVYNLRLALDGAELPGARTTSYLGGNDGTQDHAATYIGIIEATTSDQILTLEIGCAISSCGDISTVGDQTALTVAALPASAEYVRLFEAGGGQRTDQSNDPILWDTQQEVDGASFSHSTTSSSQDITLEADGDYLFFSSFWADGGVTDNVRQYPRWQWYANDTSLSRGAFGKYKRGNGENAAGAAGGVLLTGRSLGDTLELRNTNRSSDSDADSVFAGERLAVQGVRLETLIPQDVVASALGTQVSDIDIPTTQAFVGGAFALSATRDDEVVTSVRLTESGTVDAANDLDNIRLFFELDTTAPYDCAAETYDGTESQFGSTDTTGFSSADGTATFNDSVAIGTTSTLCLYTVLDVEAGAVDGETLELSIADPPSDVTLDAGAVSPASEVALPGATTLAASLLTQTHYHWRLDDGTEASASSATGAEDTPLAALALGQARRLRLGLSNAGGATTSPSTFRLEYAPQVGSCASSLGWSSVEAAGGAWDPAPSGNLTEGTDATNIATSTGGVTDENATFLAANGGIRDDTAETGSLTLSPTQFTEFEFSIESTANAVEGTTYCFRLSASGTALPAYDTYAEATIVSDLSVSAVGTQAADVTKSTQDNYLGGAFVIEDTTPGDSHT